MLALCGIFSLFVIFGFLLHPHDCWSGGYPSYPAVPYMTIPQRYIGRRLNFPNPPIYAATIALDAVSKFSNYRMDYLYAQPTGDEGGITEPPGKQCFLELELEGRVEGTCIPRTALDRCSGGIADLSPACPATTEACCVFPPDDKSARGNESKQKRQLRDTDVGIKNHGVHPKFLPEKSR